jgi:hypothetical protein
MKSSSLKLSVGLVGFLRQETPHSCESTHALVGFPENPPKPDHKPDQRRGEWTPAHSFVATASATASPCALILMEPWWSARPVPGPRNRRSPGRASSAQSKPTPTPWPAWSRRAVAARQISGRGNRVNANCSDGRMGHADKKAQPASEAIVTTAPLTWSEKSVRPFLVTLDGSTCCPAWPARQDSASSLTFFLAVLDPGAARRPPRGDAAR